jgi:hypothetical protein
LRQACPRPVVFTATGHQQVKIEKQQQTVIACLPLAVRKVWDDAAANRSLGAEINASALCRAQL